MNTEFYGSYIYHHGIKGQKWGQRNGPPYPLKPSDHSAAEKKAGQKSGLIAGSEPTAKKKDGDGKNDYDHSKSDKTMEIALLTKNLVYDALTLNPVTIAMDGKRIADAIISGQREKKYYKRIQDAPVDKKTGFPKKTADTTSEEDTKLTNPAFKNFDANTKNNCMLCTSAYELRRRGYDVIANKASYGYDAEDVNRWFPKAKVKSIETNTVKENGKEKFDLTNNAIKELTKQGDGARGNLMVQWKGLHGGHSVAYEIENGSLVIHDGQSGKTYKGNSIKKILNRSKSASYARLDDVEFDNKTIKEVVSHGKAA